MKTNSKTLVILFFLFSLSNSIFSQWQFSGSNIRNTNTGNVGIGVGNMVLAYKLHVVGNRIRVSSSTASNAKHLDLRTDGGGVDVNAVNAPLYLHSNTSNTYLQYAGGFVGIGTNSPHAPLQFRNEQKKRKIVLNEGANNDHQFYGFGVDVGTGTNAGALRYQVGSTSASHIFSSGTSSSASKELVRIQGNGSVGIGMAPSASYKLDVNGNIRCTNIFTNSDERFKTGISTIGDALDKIMALQGTTYNFRTTEFKDKELPESMQYGFIAQEVKKVLPELVTQDDNGYYAVNYQGVIPVLVEAVKEQQVQIEEKEVAIANLADNIAAIKTRIAKLEQFVAQQNPANGSPSGATSKVKANFMQVNAYPNPGKGDFTLSFQSGDFKIGATVLVMDISGRVVVKQVVEAGATKIGIDLKNEPSGTYSFQMISDGSVVATGKLVIAK